MLQLDSHLTLDQATIASPNLTSKFSDKDLQTIAGEVYNGYLRDKGSRRKWEERSEAAMDLAMQIVKDKSFPWPNCANIAFPLVTIGVLQFHARAYPAIIQGTEVVKCRVIGQDETGKQRERAHRVSTHMSWQRLEEDRDWEEQHDRTLINLACVGTAFKKSFFSPAKNYNESDLVLAKDLVVNYWAKSIEECPRKTHVIPLYRNDIREKVLRGLYRDVTKEKWFEQAPTPPVEKQQQDKDRRQGITQPMTDLSTPYTGLEQHVEMDLDGDGYAEPYIITIVAEQPTQVLRIVTGFDREEDIERVQSGPHSGKIIKIRALQYFTKYGFIPSPDGGIYDIGFGVLLGPLNESVNSVVDQLLDAGTMQTTAGGFLARGAKIRGGVYTFSPLEWKRVDSSGDDLRKSIYPLPVRDPSAVLFQLLVLLINYTQRISGSTDALVGENPGQNQPAETTRTVVDQGLKIYSAIFKRVWRSMKEEFKKLYVLNGMHVPVFLQYGDKGQKAMREDYLGDPDAICPAADPNITSEQMEMQQAMALKQAAMTTPGYDLEQVERRYLKALKIDGIDQIYPGPKKVPPLPNPKIKVAEMALQGKQLQYKHKSHEFVLQLMEDRRLNDAKIMELVAKAELEKKEAQGVESGHKIAAFEAMIGWLKVHNERLDKQIELVTSQMEQGEGEEEDGAQGAEGRGNPGVASPANNPSGQGAASPATAGAT